MCFSPQSASLNQWLEHIELLHPSSIELGLSRVKRVANRLDILPTTFTSVVVAGTNGKGSTIAALSALFSASARDEARSKPKVAVYTSPHILRFNERIVIDGVPVDDAALCDAFCRVYDALGEDRLTYFEFTTLSALLIFKRQQVDVALLEIGLGGRLDAVNIVDAELAIISSIALDHQDWLGHDREAIAREKGGVIRQNQDLVLGDSDIPKSLKALIAEKASGKLNVYYPSAALPGTGQDNHDLPACTASHGFDRLDQPQDCWFVDAWPAGSHRLAQSPALRGSDSLLSPMAWSCALTAYWLLQDDESGARAWTLCPPQELDIVALMRETTLVGRSSRHAYSGRQFILDVAHNPAAVEDLVARRKCVESRKSDDGLLAEPVTEQPATLLFAAMADKELDVMLGHLLGEFDQVSLVGLPAVERSARLNELTGRVERIVRSEGLSVEFHGHENMSLAINWAIQQTPANATIWVLGSFFTVAAALEIIEA